MSFKLCEHLTLDTPGVFVPALRVYMDTSNIDTLPPYRLSRLEINWGMWTIVTVIATNFLLIRPACQG